MMNKMRMLESTLFGNKKTFGSVSSVFNSQSERVPSDPAKRADWRDSMISMLKALGQLKRKGKFDEHSEFMRPNQTSG